MINFEQPNPKTLIINGRTIEFQQSVTEILPFPDRVVVLLHLDDFEFGDKLVGRNVLAYGLDGEELWRIEDHGFTLGARREDTVTKPDETGRRRVSQSFIGIDFDKEDGTILATLPAVELDIDPEDGKIINWEQRR